MERKWYIKDEGRTTLWGFPDDVELHHPTAILVQDRPSDNHVWSIQQNTWVIDVETLKRTAEIRVKMEFTRISKYLPIINSESMSILDAYVQDLKTYLTQFQENSSFPNTPEILKEDNFMAFLS